MSNQGWENWEGKLNEKTARRRERRKAYRAARMAQFEQIRRWIFFCLEVLLFLIGVIVLANYIAGNIHIIVFQAVFGIVAALMTFCAGYFLGATKH